MARIEHTDSTAAIVTERWKTATRDVRAFEGEYGLSTVVSERWDKANDGLEELAVMLVEEYHDLHAAADGSDDLDALMYRIWTHIEAESIAWATRVQTRRDDPRKVAAA
jgi:hypothetical protein